MDNTSLQTFYTKVKQLSLQNFTVFEKIHLSFCPGINLFIGANSSGKSNILKLIYTLLNIVPNRADENYIKTKLHAVFRPDKITDLIRHNNNQPFVINLGCENMNIELIQKPDADLVMKNSLDDMLDDIIKEPIISVIYLPPQEFLAINEGFIMAGTQRLPFSDTYYDLSIALQRLPLPRDKSFDLKEAITLLEEIITEEKSPQNEVITHENGHFYFNLPEGKLNVHQVADGYRKIGTLLYLLRNGSLTQNSILFWDEPEANLNPKLIVKVVKILQILAQLGLQIFVTTHDYLLSYELSLLAEYSSKNPLEIKFFALHKPTRLAGIEVETGNTLAEIENNLILEEFAAHHDREVMFFKGDLA